MEGFEGVGDALGWLFEGVVCMVCMVCMVVVWWYTM